MRHKYLFILLICWLSACAFLFLHIYGTAKERAVSDLNARQIIHARQAKIGIQNFFDQLIRFLRNTATSENIADFNSLGIREMTFAQKIMPKGCTAMTRVARDGRIIYSVPYLDGIIGRDISSQPHIRKILERHQPVVSDVFTAVQGMRAIALHVPVYKDKAFAGTLGVLIDFTEISERFLGAIRIGETGYAWVTSASGVELYCPVPGHTDHSVFDNCKEFPSIIAMAKKMVKGAQGTTTYSFDRIKGEKTKTITKHAVYMPAKLADTFWTIVVASSEEELLSTLVDFKNKLIVLFGLLLLGSFYFSYYGMKSWGVVREQAHRRRAEEELTRIFDMSIDMIGVADIRTATFLKVNRAFTDTLGYSEAELLSKPFFEFIHPEDIAQTRATVDKKLSLGEKVVNFDNRYRCKDGRYRWLSWVSQPNIDTGRTYAVARDITDIKKTEQELKDSKSLLEAAGRLARVGGWELDAETLAVSWTAETYRIHEVPKDYAPPLTDAINFFHPEDRPRLTAAIQRALDDGEPYDMEVRFITAKGNRLWARTICRPEVVNGKTVRLKGTFQDISDRKQAEAALQESEEKFRNFAEQSLVGFYIVQDGIFRYVNPKFAEIFGYSVDECMDGMHIRHLVHSEDLEMVQRQVQRRVTGEVASVQYRFRGVTKSGDIIHVEIFGSTLTFQGRPAAIGTMLDITKELELEQRIAQSQRMEAIGALAGGIAHDFNNILFPIVGLSEMLVEDLPAGSPERDNAWEIFNAGKRGSGLVKQILTFSRQSEQKKMPVRIQQVLKEAMRLCRSTIPANIPIDQEIQGDCRRVLADPTQIHQIAMNLVTNAYHAVEEKSGRITVTLNEIGIGAEDLSDTDLTPGEYLLLTVSDTGFGIDPAIVDKIFDPYFTTKAQGKGTGLGLSVVYGIVKEHQGDIKVYSELGNGSTFKVFLPLMEETADAEPVIAADRYRGGDERILLVDDEEAIAMLEKKMLERLGYKVTMCVRSLEALTVFRTRPDGFDLVISDMTMPDMTGDQLAAQLKALRPQIPIIICTGFSERINDDKAAQLGIAGILMKPIIKSQIATMVRDVLDGSTG